MSISITKYILVVLAVVGAVACLLSLEKVELPSWSAPIIGILGMAAVVGLMMRVWGGEPSKSARYWWHGIKAETYEAPHHSQSMQGWELLKNDGQKGFTLKEFLIVLSIFAVIIVIASTSLKQNYEMIKKHKEVVSFLRCNLDDDGGVKMSKEFPKGYKFKLFEDLEKGWLVWAWPSDPGVTGRNYYIATSEKVFVVRRDVVFNSKYEDSDPSRIERWRIEGFGRYEVPNKGKEN